MSAMSAAVPVLPAAAPAHLPQSKASCAAHSQGLCASTALCVCALCVCVHLLDPQADRQRPANRPIIASSGVPHGRVRLDGNDT